MAKDRNGTEIKVNDRVQIEAVVVYSWTRDCRVRIDGPPEIGTTEVIIPDAALLVIPPMRVTDPNKE